MGSCLQKPNVAVTQTLLSEENNECIDCGLKDVSQKCLYCEGYLCEYCIKFDSPFCWNCQQIKVVKYVK